MGSGLPENTLKPFSKG